MSTEKKYILLLGNVGVGKSAICNALGATCASATQGAAVTTKCSLQSVLLKEQEVIVIDAPGLYERDKEKVQRNAKEIREALQYDGTYRLIFVLTLSGGRLPEGELATMKSIYAAIDRSNEPIGVIINKLNKREMRMLEKEREEAYLYESLQMACGAQVGSEACKISIFKIPVDGVGEDWDGQPPHPILTEWLLGLVTAGIKGVREIVISDKTIDDMKARVKALEAGYKASEEKYLKMIHEQREMIEEQNRKARENYNYKPLKTTVTNQSHLPYTSEYNGRELREVEAKFTNEEEKVQVLVDNEAFDRCTKAKWTIPNVISRTVYAYISVKSVFAVPIIDAIVSDDSLHINTPKAKEWDCGEVVRVESIIDGELVVNTNKSIEWSTVSDNKTPDVESTLKFSKIKSTENTFSLTSASKADFNRLHSAITKFDLSVQSILTGSIAITSQLTSNASSETTAHSSAVSKDEILEEVTFKVAPGQSVRITKWRHEKVKTTPFTMTTVYDGHVLLCKPGITNRRLTILARELWPASEISWQVTEKEIEILYKSSPAECGIRMRAKVVEEASLRDVDQFYTTQSADANLVTSRMASLQT